MSRELEPNPGTERLLTELQSVTAELERLQGLHDKFPVRVGVRIQQLLGRGSRHHPTTRLLLWPFAKLLALLQRFERTVVLQRWADRLLFLDPPEYWICNPGLRRLLASYLLGEVRERLGVQRSAKVDQWFHRYRADDELLGRLRARVWPVYAPTFTVVLRARPGSAGWLESSVASVQAQTYPRWELLCLRTATPRPAGPLLDPRVRFLGAAGAAGTPAGPRTAVDQARGDFVCWLEEGDALEPHALHRFADAVLDSGADVLYSDEVRAGDDLSCIVEVKARPQFSYDHYLSHAYFEHLVAVRHSLLQTADALDLASGDAIVLKALEQARTVAHVPDILYRHRTSGAPPDATEAPRVARVRRHLARLGYDAEVASTARPECLDVRYPLSRRLRIAIIIPTKNRGDLLQRCIETVEKTIPPDLATIHVVDHESDDPDTLAYLEALRERHQVLPYVGRFNFSRINNHAVNRCGPGYTHYLFLNNDIEAVDTGWLEHMATLGQRDDVGIVGAVLLYPDHTVQHAGTMIGLHFGADHVHRSVSAYGADGRRAGGPDLCLLATRDVSAVTGACMLVSAEAFHAVGGFDVNLAVGFGDTDLCLRARARGYKVLLDTQAVLTHLGSATRGKDRDDPHPDDTQFLRARYLQMILAGDPFFSPFASRHAAEHLNPDARCRETVTPRVVRVVLPQLPGQARGR